MTVSPIRKNKVLQFGEWSIDHPDHQLAEMFNNKGGHLVGLGVRVIELGWLWETVNPRDEVLDFGIEQNNPAAKLAAEASAKRILLAA
jgi:hypothetical protein